MFRKKIFVSLVAAGFVFSSASVLAAQTSDMPVQFTTNSVGFSVLGAFQLGQQTWGMNRVIQSKTVGSFMGLPLLVGLNFFVGKMNLELSMIGSINVSSDNSVNSYKVGLAVKKAFDLNKDNALTYGLEFNYMDGPDLMGHSFQTYEGSIIAGAFHSFNKNWGLEMYVPVLSLKYTVTSKTNSNVFSFSAIYLGATYSFA